MLRIWDTATGQALHEIEAFQDWNTGAVAFSPDGRCVASGGREGVIKLFDTETGRLWKTLPGRPESVARLEFSPDGRLLMSSGIDASVWVWDLATGGARWPSCPTRCARFCFCGTSTICLTPRSRPSSTSHLEP